MEIAQGNRTGCRKAIFAGKLTFSSMKEIYAGRFKSSRFFLRKITTNGVNYDIILAR